MSHSMNNPDGNARDEALSWLAGQFRWESLLADLQALAAEQHDEESAAYPLSDEVASVS